MHPDNTALNPVAEALDYSCENNYKHSAWGCLQKHAIFCYIDRRQEEREPRGILNYISEEHISCDVNWKCHLE